jgi:hypothetical protein
MLVKVVGLFLLVMVVLAVFGRLRLPGKGRLASRRCTRCGRYRIGTGPCDCGNA